MACVADFDNLTPEERAYLLSRVGSAAFAWIAAVGGGDTAAVWRGLDPDFRLALVQQWLHDNPAALDDPSADGSGRDDLAAVLAVERPDHPLWRHCARVSMRAIKSGTAGVEDLEIGQGTRTRAVGPDLEVVHLIPLDQLPTDADGFKYHPPGVTVTSLALVMHLAEGEWKVAGIGPRLPTPGWPPVWTELPVDIVQ
jgi:hypothetical protein